MGAMAFQIINQPFVQAQIKEITKGGGGGGGGGGVTNARTNGQ